mmetsp:Transcript_80740/g.210229  ORF Transcript_80740/g.210229 Transcript_80740/m.210229 type:complete len:80 (+) Transcript_80740:445-684(+)
MAPFFSTTMTSAVRIVERRWATTMCVRPERCVISVFRASCTTPSDSASNADVASSKSKIVGLAIKARAMATRCFWPPES